MSKTDFIDNHFIARFSRWVVVCCFVVLAIGAATFPEKPVSRVVMLKHLAVILPEFQTVRESWGKDCSGLWTPTVRQVEAAEKAILQGLQGMKKHGAKVDPREKYLIQYFGIVLDEKKLIECQVYKLEALRKNRGLRDFPEMLVSLLTFPYDEADSDDCFDAVYDPSTNQLSKTLGTVRNESD